MTDEEKAKSICRVYIDDCDEKCTTCIRGSAFFDLMEMANFKNRQLKKQKSNIEDFARDYASNVSDNEKEFFIAKDAVMKTFEFLTQNQ